MDNKVEYEILAAHTRKELVDEVNKAIKLGWVLMGGPTIAVKSDNTTLWIQATIRQKS